MRKTFLIAGGILWIAALAGLYIVFVRPAQEPQQSVPSHAVTNDSETNEPTASVSTASPNTDDQPTEVWDPNGIEDFALIERSGRTVTKADLLGRPWAVCFVFTRCAGPCPRVTGQMRLLHDRLADRDVRFVTISVDPKNDTPEVLGRYADAFGADAERWLFLTGDQSEIYHLIQHSFKMPVKELVGKDRQPGFEIIHTTNVMHVNAEGRVVGKYNALKDTEMAALRRALVEELEQLEAADDASVAEGG